MAKGKFPGMGGGNMNNMMKQMQKMQKQMEDMQAELEVKEVETSSGGGAVKVTANGKKEILNISIDESVVDKEDIEMLQDLILVAVNDALNKAEEMMTNEMKKITGGLNIPNLY
ncbi:YbaB/EbfC family nucleoid-associated protein [Paratissierella segnis]|jgi:hypothetical protein|uniref:Nucleoid-associated protein H8707_03585 n=1 Tax=Paratissierella segnis TaxID=2763679 RepID=A0A926IEF6_9FIRM|nr:YbaB/EbfC family nucleoid-associated protein [Paratissierella segnis]MBC8587322.1 YbaB/EbfC family nucleoid-associated protein [Paratissierella segnis]